MRERASLIGGSFTIESQPDAGTVIQIRVPV
jgi:signal transduction histidine kinase